MDVTSMTALMIVRSAAVDTRESNVALIKETLEKAKEPNPEDSDQTIRSVEESGTPQEENSGAVDVSV